MRYITRHLIVYIAILLTSLSPSVVAIELLDANIPAPLKNAYHGRYKAPDACVETTEVYIKHQQTYDMNSGPITDESDDLANNNALPIQLLAFCYAQIEDYQQAYQLLTTLLKKQTFSPEQLRSLNILASEIPEDKRTEFSDQLLIKIFTTSLRKMELAPFLNSPNLEAKLLLTITKLSLATNQYRNANISLEAAKNVLKNSQSSKLKAWLAYYYGLYYEKINQQQLAVSNLFTASKLADKHNFIKLSGEAKKSIASLYQKEAPF